MDTLNIIHVFLQRGEGLSVGDSNGLSDPFCVLSLDGEQRQTSQTINRTLNPDWNQDFYFVESANASPQQHRRLGVEVYDSDMLTSSKLGAATVDLSSLPGVGGASIEYEIRLPPTDYRENGKVFLTVRRITLSKAELNTKRNEGKVRFRKRDAKPFQSFGSFFSTVKDKITHPHMPRTVAKAVPGMANGHMASSAGGSEKNTNQRRGRSVTVDVIEARGIPVMDWSTKSTDPYVSVKLGNTVRRTKVKYHNLNPVWKQRFMQTIFDMGGRNSSIIEFTLWDKDTLGMNEKIATLKLDLALFPLGETNETFWKCQRYEPKKSFFSFGRSGQSIAAKNTGIAAAAAAQADGKTVDQAASEAELPDIELLLVITVADLYEPLLIGDELIEAKKKTSGWLQCTVHRAVDLGSFDFDGSSDPFVVVDVGIRHRRTHTIENSLNPVWDTEFGIPIDEIFDVVNIKVFDEDMGGRFELMGSLAIPLLEIENSNPKWYQLKDKSMMRPAKGVLLLSLDFTYQKLPMLTTSMGRRPPKHLVQERKFKFALLKAHVLRLSELSYTALEASLLVFRILGWEFGAPSTLLFGVAWTVFWYYVELWHLPIAGMLALLFVGESKVRVTKTSTGDWDLVPVDSENRNKNAPSWEEQYEEEEGIAAAEDAPPPADPGSGSLLTQWHQMVAMSQYAQNTLGDIISHVERWRNLFKWERPWLTFIFCILLLITAIVLFAFPFRGLAIFYGWYYIIVEGLAKYHPAYKRGKHEVVYTPIIEFVARVPDNAELKQQHLLPLPDEYRG